MTVAGRALSELPWVAPAETAGTLERSAGDALSRSANALLDMQDPAGWWKGDLETNVAIEAEDLLLRAFLGILDDETLALTANWIRSKQCADGGWSSHYGGPSDVSLAVEAYTALRLAGDSPDAEHMRLAAEFVRDSGGMECARVFTRIWLALFGLWPWEDLPAMPPELILLPRWVPLNIYDFGCWARQTIVPLTIVGTYRPQREMAFSVDELRTGEVSPERRPQSIRTPAGLFQRFDRVLQKYYRRPLWRLREMSMKLAEQWIIRRQEADGCWGGIQPPWVYSIIALHLRGYSLDHPVLARALAGFDTFEVREGDMRWMECCQSPVWDTALAVVALGDAGLRRDDPAMVAAADWLLDEEVQVRGDWAARRPQLAPGGWAFEFHNDNYPDLDDTAEVVLALAQAEASEGRARRRGHRTRRLLGRGHAVQRRRVRGVRRRQRAAALRATAVLRLRRGDRSAQRRRHGARRGDAVLGAHAHRHPGGRPAVAARRGLALAQPGVRRLVVRALGGQPPVRARRRAAGPARRRGAAQRPAHPSRRPAGCTPPRVPTADGVRI